MRKSKYLVLSPLYFKFKEDLFEIDEVKKSFENQNVIDLLRFNKLSIIPKLFDGHNIKKSEIYKFIISFVYFPDNIKNIDMFTFSNNQIKYINLSNIKNLNILDMGVFENNQIINLTLPSSITKITWNVFRNNHIKYLDLSNCINLKEINMTVFADNNIINLKLPNNIETLSNSPFKKNNINYLNLVNCKNLIKVIWDTFCFNPLKEIKINNNINIVIDDNYYIYSGNYKNDSWYEFVDYYNETNKRSGDYKYEDDEWQWYPL